MVGEPEPVERASAWFRWFSTAMFGRPMIRRLIEKSAIMVRIEASRCRMRKRTLTKAVTKPASAPATMRQSRREPRIPAGDDADRRHRGAERERAVDRQVGKVEHAERQEDAERHEGVDQAKLDGAEKSEGGH